MPNKISYFIILLCACIPISAQTYKSNTIAVSANFVYFPDWQGLRPLRNALRLDYFRHINSHFFIGLGAESIFSMPYKLNPNEINVPFTEYKATQYYDIVCGYDYYITRKIYLKGAIALSYRTRRNSVIESIHQTNSGWHESVNYLVMDKKIGFSPSLHGGYLLLKWLDISVGAYYRYYQKNTALKYLQSENRFLLSGRLGFKFGKNKKCP